MNFREKVPFLNCRLLINGSFFEQSYISNRKCQKSCWDFQEILNKDKNFFPASIFSATVFIFCIALIALQT